MKFPLIFGLWIGLEEIGKEINTFCVFLNFLTKIDTKRRNFQKVNLFAEPSRNPQSHLILLTETY